MTYLNKTFSKAINNKDYWRKFHYADGISNVPIERGIHSVLVYFRMSNVIVEMKANWNSCDWITKDGEEISAMVMGFKE